MTTPLNLRAEHREDGTPVLIATGEIDLSNIERFTHALSNAVREGTPVTVDLGAVDYLDSSALNALFSHADHIRLIANRLLIPALTVSGLTELAPVQLVPPPTEPQEGSRSRS